jgi:hypothetical protein
MRRSLLLILATISVSVPCFGWGFTAHRIASAIAQHYLTEKTKKAVDELLDGQTLAQASTWADEIRSDARYNWAKPLHYINVPRNAERVDMRRDCDSGECVGRD